MGLFEVRFGHDGVSTAIGTGGADASLGAIGAALKGGLNWGVSGLSNVAARRDGVGNAATALRSQWGFGDENAKDQLFDILFGETRMRRGASEASAAAETVRDEDGRRVVELNRYKDEMTLEEQLLLGVNLQHEAYRDGYNPGMVDAQGNEVTLESNMAENRPAVLAHTEMALRMANDQQYTETMLGLINGNENLRKDIAMYTFAKELDDMSIMGEYSDFAYGSESDYFDPIQGFTFSDFFKQLFSNSSTKIYGTIIDAMNGDRTAQAVLGYVTKETMLEISVQGAELGTTMAEGVSTTANMVAIGATLTGDIPVAGVAELVAVAADSTGLALSLLTQNNEKTKMFLASVSFDILFKGISTFTPNVLPVWNSGANRYINPITGQFVNTNYGKLINTIPSATGIVAPILFDIDGSSKK
jgi:hypothetical protein